MVHIFTGAEQLCRLLTTNTTEGRDTAVTLPKWEGAPRQIPRRPYPDGLRRGPQ
jgi:hypothetical protein